MNRHQGAIHHAGLWQGLLTDEQIRRAYRGELAAGLTGDWRLRGDGVDASAHARDLTVTGAGQWVEDQYGRQGSALRLFGSGGVESTGPTVRTDRSFSVAAWVRLDDKDGDRTVVSQAGTGVANFNVNYHLTSDRWQFSMASHDGPDDGSVSWRQARSRTAPVVGQWYHLVGVFDDAAGQLRFYLDGELQSTTAAPAAPWRATGPLLVGIAGTASGERYHPMLGTVSDVGTRRGALVDEQAAEVYGGNPAVQWLSRWNLDGDGTDRIGGHHLTMVGAEGVDYDWVEDRACRPWSALGLQMSGSGHARTGGPVMVTDESFTVSTWVKLDTVGGGHQTVLSQSGATRPAFYLQATPEGSWRFTMPQADAATTTWVTTPERPGCLDPAPVASDNHAARRTVTGRIELDGASESRVFALLSGSSADGTGDYRATDLSPAGSWTAGGNDGGFGYDYPLRVPPAAGPVPEVSLGYSSTSHDGRTSGTNNQASWIGDGWGYEPGFVERSYQGCALDKGGNTPDLTGDLCWSGDGAHITIPASRAGPAPSRTRRAGRRTGGCWTRWSTCTATWSATTTSPRPATTARRPTRTTGSPTTAPPGWTASSTGCAPTTAACLRPGGSCSPPAIGAWPTAAAPPTRPSGTGRTRRGTGTATPLRAPASCRRRSSPASG